MKKLKTKWFTKWATKNHIEDNKLFEAIGNLESDLSSVDLGSNIFKIRIARDGSGKSGGFRTILVYKENDKAIFIHGFAKNEMGNISKKELRYFKTLGKDLLSLNQKQLDIALEKNILHEIGGKS